MTFGQRVRAFRYRYGMSQARLRADAGISGAFLSDLENDKAEPGARTLEAIADVLGVTMDELWRGVGRGEFSEMPAAPIGRGHTYRAAHIGANP